METSDSAKLKLQTDDRYSFHLRNSAVKRTYKPRRKLDITPIRYDADLKEIENEPLPALLFSDLDDSSNSNNLKESTELCKIDENSDISKDNRTDESSNNKVDGVHENHTDESSNDKVDGVHDSFDIDFGMLSLHTPVKTNEQLSCNSALCSASQKHNVVQSYTDKKKVPEHPFITPKYNKIVPKVQCSVDVKSYLTPMNTRQKFPSSKENITPFAIQNDTCRKSENRIMTTYDKENVKQKVQFSLPKDNLLDKDLTFKKVVVNHVEYIVLKLLGKGGSSKVFHCYNIETKSNHAIKCVSLSNPDSATGYINEVKLLEKLQNCDRIVKMYDYEIRESEKRLLVVLEMGGADLARILCELSTNTVHLPMYMLLFYWMEMLYAVKQIHSNGIIHSDLKPANFLKAEGGLKLIDFGIASCIQSDMTSVLKTVPEGSFNYISPEALNNEATSVNSPNVGKPKYYKISYKSDVWSLGCILYQLVYRKTPFQHITHMWTKLATVSNPKHVIEYPDANWVPLRVITTIKKCLQYDMRSRPSVDELIAEYENIFSGL